MVIKISETKVVYSVDCSSIVEETIKAKGGIPIVSKVGRTFIIEKMVEESAILGGESSSHFYFGEIRGFDDGIFASLPKNNVKTTIMQKG